MNDAERFAVVDVETTGLSPRRDRVVEIACVLVDGGQVRDRWATLVNPGVPIPESATRIHGIGDADVRDAPTMPDALAMLAAMIGGRTLAAHCAPFDLAFLSPYRPLRSMCTMRLARVVVPWAPDHKNQTLRRFFGIDRLLERDAVAHRALDDALVTAHVLLACRRLCDGARWAQALQAATIAA